MTEEINEDSTLPQVFSAAKKLMDAVRQSKEVGNSERAQEDLEKAIQLLERCSKMVSSLQLFSKNESVDEISTSSLPYILLPAYLAEMTNLQKVSSAADREPIVETVVIYYEDFLQRCLDYELFDGPIPKQFALTSATSSLQDQMKSRQDKIQKYIQRRENETKLQAFRELQISSAVIDEETTREINLLSIKVAIDDACENLTHFLQEKSLLSQRDGWPEHPSEYYSESTRPETNSLTRPAVLILTRDQIEKSVFGTGFPSVPTMTLDEWYESQCQHASGTGLPERGLQSKTGDPELDSRLEQKAKIEREELQEERDDPELLAKRRNFDNYKDDHRRGSGNTIGKG